MAKLVLGTNKSTYAIPASVRNVTPEYYTEFVVDSNGTIDYSKNTKPMDFSGVKEAPIYRLSYAYYNSTYDNLGYNLDLSSLTTIGNYGLYCTFYGCNFVRGALNFDNLNSIGQYGLGSAFYSCPNINSVKFSKSDMSNGQYSLSYAFAYCSALSTVDMSKVITVGSNNYIFNYAFRGCTNLQTVDLSSLVYIYSYTFYYAFLDCTSLTSVDLSGLVSLYTSGRQQFYGTFSGCTSLTSFVFNSLARLTRNTLSYSFQNCTSLTSVSFPALTTNSFGSYTNQFSSMLVGCSNVTVHFPSNLQSVIGSWTDIINGFGGTGTTVLYDLPATIEIIGANNSTYLRQPKKDTSTALAWYYNATTTSYTSGTSNPSVGDTIYSDAACTTSVTTVNSIIS